MTLTTERQNLGSGLWRLPQVDLRSRRHRHRRPGVEYHKTPFVTDGGAK